MVHWESLALLANYEFLKILSSSDMSVQCNFHDCHLHLHHIDHQLNLFMSIRVTSYHSVPVSHYNYRVSFCLICLTFTKTIQTVLHMTFPANHMVTHGQLSSLPQSISHSITQKSSVTFHHTSQCLDTVLANHQFLILPCRISCFSISPLEIIYSDSFYLCNWIQYWDAIMGIRSCFIVISQLTMCWDCGCA